MSPNKTEQRDFWSRTQVAAVPQQYFIPLISVFVCAQIGSDAKPEEDHREKE